MLHQGVIELNGNIEELQHHIADLKQMPIDSDPRVQELQGLDLASWELHLQQWMLQRDNLVSSLDSIQQAQGSAGQGRHRRPMVGATGAIHENHRGIEKQPAKDRTEAH